MILSPLVYSFPYRQGQILQFSSQFIIFCNKQKILIHVIKRMKDCRVASYCNRGQSLFDRYQCCSADTCPFRNKFCRQSSSKPCIFDLHAHPGKYIFCFR